MCGVWLKRQMSMWKFFHEMGSSHSAKRRLSDGGNLGEAPGSFGDYREVEEL
jgi:hypothetical protein